LGKLLDSGATVDFKIQQWARSESDRLFAKLIRVIRIHKGDSISNF